MTKSKQRYFQNLRCEGCELRCQYRCFRGHGPNAGLFVKRRSESQRKKDQARLGKRKPTSEYFAEEVRSYQVESEDSTKWKYKRRGTILGSMHATKYQLWIQYTENCPHNTKPSIYDD